jgi:hypothetical protein
VSTGSHWVYTVRVAAVKDAPGWRRPGISPDCQTRRACAPRYQPTRYAETRNDAPVVDTCKVNGWPGDTLTWSV